MSVQSSPEFSTPEQQLDTAWINRNNGLYDLERQMSEQSMEIAAAIAAGAPASLEQFVYAALGAHPDWKDVYERTAAVNEQLQSNVPLALFSEGDMRYFGYPSKFGTRPRSGSTSKDQLAFDYTIETSQQRNAQFAKLSPIFGQKAIEGTTTHYYSNLSLPMRVLYDFKSRGAAGDPTRSEDDVLPNMFSSSLSTLYRAPRSSAEYRLRITTADDENPQEKLVVASGMHDIVKLASKNLTDINLRRLKFAIKHEERDLDDGID